jgi:[acyl-carrier-protein] S-malonyltransferase
MTKLACIFPGQGSQEIGMGKIFYDNFTSARQVFQEVDDALRLNLSKIIFEGDAEKLTLTENAQPAIMATSMAILRALQVETGFDVAGKASFVAGHSLGEYSALCAAGVFSLSDTARLLRLRGQAMQSSMPNGAGGMAAIIGLSTQKIDEILDDLQGVCEIANDNCDGQVVISGAKEALQEAMALLKNAGAKRVLELNVSAPFHCSLIANAADIMQEALSQVKMNAPKVKIICNVTASAEDDLGRIASLLVAQVTGRVRWRESVEYMAEQGVQEVLEIGHGAVLTGLCKRISKDIICTNINDLTSFDKMVKAA